MCIRDRGYLGINQTACSCTVGTLPSGVTVKSNTAATASKAGSVVLAFAANATLGGAAVLNGTIDLTFTISGASVVKKFAWTKSNKGSNGASGANAIVFSVYAVSYTHLIRDLDLLTIGLVLDMWTEKSNDGVKYKRLATQEDFDKF